MPSSRTKTESESTDFSTKPAETDRLQDSDNRIDTTFYYHVFTAFNLSNEAASDATIEACVVTCNVICMC